jgi:putative FmdB family regulatory protein
MPVYEFECERCGPFDEFRDHRSAAEPMACPSCGAPARRRYSAVYLNRKAWLRGAANPELQERIERSHTGEPNVVRGSPTAPGGEAGSSGRSGGSEGGIQRSTGRPWMLGH